MKDCPECKEEELRIMAWRRAERLAAEDGHAQLAWVYFPMCLELEKVLERVVHVG